MCFEVHKASLKCLMHRALGRLRPHVRRRSLLSLLYPLLSMDQVSVALGAEQETALPVRLENNAGLIDLLSAPPPPGTLPS